MTQRYAILDSAGAGTSLSVEQSGEILSIDAASLAKRSALVDIGQTEYVHAAEVMFYTTDEEPADPDDSLTDNAAVGIATSDFDTSSYVGADAYSIGYLPAEGKIYVGGVEAATVTAAAKGDIIGIVADLDALQLFVLLNGQQIHVHDLDESTWAGATWYLAVSLGSDSEADMHAFVNTGQRTFQHESALSEGWYDVPETIAPERVASKDYTTAPDDTPANTQALGLIVNTDGLAIERSLKFWTEGDVAVARPAVAKLRIINGRLASSYRFDALIGDTRDLPVTLYEGDRDEAFSTFTQLCAFVLDSVEAISDQVIEITLKSNEARLDRPVQRKLFLPNVEGQAANRPVPITLGAVFNQEPVLVDAATLTYIIHDSPLLGIGYVRDRGDKLELDASPVPFEFLPDFTGIKLTEEPVGKLTLDASSVGGDLPAPPTNIAPANLAAWDDSLNVAEASGVYTFSDNGASFGFIEAYLKATGILTVGKLYRFKVPITEIEGTVPGLGQYVKFEIAHGISTSNYPRAQWTEAGTHTVTFIASGVDFVLRMIGTDSLSDVVKMTIATLEVYEVDQDGVDSDNLLPITLAEFLDEIMERGDFETSEWSRADAEAIDTATGYAGIGWHTKEQVTIREALEDVLPSYSACMAQDRAGVLRIFQLQAPEDRSAESEGSIGNAEILKPGLRVRPYHAPGLATRFGCKRNETRLDPSDFMEDYDSVTGADVGTRTRLGKQYQEIVDSGARLAGGYVHAKGAIHGTRLVRKADALAEAIRVGAIFDQQRYLYEFDVPIEESGQYDLDQIWLLTYTDASGIARYNLSGGLYVCIVGITEKPDLERATLTCFG